MRALRLALVLSVLGTATPTLPAAEGPSHERPYFMPESERQRIHRLVAAEPWAGEARSRIEEAARKGDGFRAAWLYALERDAAWLPAARRFLAEKYGERSWWVTRARAAFADPKFFTGGTKDGSTIYYDTDITALLAFDWAYPGLDPADRRAFAAGIRAWSDYKRRAMDAWVQTPNLVFKPTYTVALAGLATNDPELIEWGFHRTKPWGPRLGGVFEVLKEMLRDGGPWLEAPIYPIAHQDLQALATLAWARSLWDGQDWFAREVAPGASVKGLMDYYLDSAYPLERTGSGAGRIRIATYGDGATNAKGDLFLVDAGAEPGGLNAHAALAAAHRASGDPRYAAFLALVPGFTPDLMLGGRALGPGPAFPAAPSKVWPTYGLAMLRSDETPGYFRNPRALAAFLLGSRGYGHDHRDKLALIFHGANRLLYPDYNAIQYENAELGWTRSTPSHSTVMVDEREAGDAAITGLASDFSQEVKFVSFATEAVYEGVSESRSLFLTSGYLLDLFRLSSAVPHTYDYLLHAFGEARPAAPEALVPSDELTRRYWLVEGQRTVTTAGPFTVDFVQQGAPETAVRVRLAATPRTTAGIGRWGDELARRVRESGHGRLDAIGTLIARRTARETVFAVTHEPYAAGEAPRVAAVTRLAEADGAVLVRVDGAGFTDYAAVAPEDARTRTLGAGEMAIAFRGHAYVRVGADGRATARGALSSLRVPGATSLSLNGEPARTAVSGRILTFGTPATSTPSAPPDPESPLPVRVSPGVVRVFERDRRTVTLTVSNPLRQPVAGRITFDAVPGLSFEPRVPSFGPIAAGASGSVSVTVVADRPTEGRRTVPFRVTYGLAGDAPGIRTAARPLQVVVGTTLETVYRHPKPAQYRVLAPGYTSGLRMFDALVESLEDPDGEERLAGPLFTLSDGKADLLYAGTVAASVWPRVAPAQLTAAAGKNEPCRWQAVFLGDRVLFRMDRLHTQFERAFLTFPGAWRAPAGAARWRSVVTADGTRARPEGKVRMAAAELELPGSAWNVALVLEPAQEVTFDGPRLAFSVSARSDETWQVGFCRPGELDSFRRKR